MSIYLNNISTYSFFFVFFNFLPPAVLPNLLYFLPAPILVEIKLKLYENLKPNKNNSILTAKVDWNENPDDDNSENVDVRYSERVIGRRGDKTVNGETDSDNDTGITVLLEADGTKAKV